MASTRVLDHIRSLPGCADIEVKFSGAAAMPFHRMKVRLKREIVTMGQGDLDPAHNAGTYVDPQDWNALIADPDTIVIDTRNDYEVAVGKFAGAIDPKTPSFRDFPEWFRAERERLLGDGQGAEGRHVLHRRHPLREIHRLPQGRGGGGGLPPQGRHPEIS